MAFLFTRPISALFVLMALFFLISPLILKLWGRKHPGLLVKD